MANVWLDQLDALTLHWLHESPWVFALQIHCPVSLSHRFVLLNVPSEKQEHAKNNQIIHIVMVQA